MKTHNVKKNFEFLFEKFCPKCSWLQLKIYLHASDWGTYRVTTLQYSSCI